MYPRHSLLRNALLLLPKGRRFEGKSRDFSSELLCLQAIERRIFSDFRFQSTVRATLASLSHGSCDDDDDDIYVALVDHLNNVSVIYAKSWVVKH